MLQRARGIEMTAEEARLESKSLASPAAAKAARFFETGLGQYGERSSSS